MPDWRTHIRAVLDAVDVDSLRRDAIVAELASHLDDRYRAALTAGATDEEATRLALDELDDPHALVSEVAHAETDRPLPSVTTGRGAAMTGIWQDLRYGVRMIRRNPGFALIAALTLALGIGANGAIFSVVHAVLIRELPYGDPDRLVMVWESRPREGVTDNTVSPADFLDWRARQQVFDGIAAASPMTLNLSGSDEPERLMASGVSASFFAVLGVAPSLGRGFRSDEEQAGSDRVVVLSEGLWQRRFGGDPNTVGTRITLSGQPYEVIGVLPASFRFGEPAVDVFFPLDFTHEDMRARFNHFLRVYARLKPGMTIARAQEDMDSISAQLQREVVLQNQGHGAHVIALREQLVGDVRSSLLILMAAVAFILLIACVNVANLLLARGASRGKEMALRASLGAGRGRIVQQVFMECLSLAALATLVAVPMAIWGVRALKAIVPQEIPRLNEAGLSLPVVGFMAATALMTGVLFSSAPALQVGRLNPAQSLKQGGGSAGLSRRRLRKGLVVAEVALSFVLLVGAGLMARTLINMLDVDAGFDADNVVTVPVALDRASSLESTTALFRELDQNLRNHPGVVQLGFTSHVPMAFDDSRSGLAVEGRPRDPNEQVRAHWRVITPGFFAAVGIRLREGRVPTDAETEQRAAVALINETAAERYWPGASPVGRRLRILTPEWREIIGVVEDVRHWGPVAPVNPEVYLPGLRSPTNLVVRSSQNPVILTSVIRAELRRLSPDLPVSTVTPLSDVRARWFASPRFYLIVLGLFAGVALVLSVIGVYGVMSCTVAHSRRDIGIRMAIGAPASGVIRMFVGEGLILTALGLAIGGVGAFASTRLMTALLFGVTPTDVSTFLAIAALLGVVALAAVYIPARRAASVDPLIALKHE
jgi:putative ABC transport system permease protein